MSFSLRLAVVMMMLLTATALGLVAFQVVRPVPLAVPAQVAAPAPLTTGYLVAAHALPAGPPARGDDFLVKVVSASELPSGAIGDTPDARSGIRGSLIRTY